MGPKVEMEGGVLILGKDTGWVGRRRVAQIAGWREGFGVWEKSQQAYLHLGKMAVAALVGAGVEAEAVADIKGRVDCGALSPSEPEEFTPGRVVGTLQRPREAAAVPAVASRLPCNNLPNGRCLLSPCFAPDTMENPSH